MDELLGNYLGRSPGDGERKALAAQDLLSRYLEVLWHATGQAGDASGYPLAAEAAALGELLGVSPGSY